VTSDAPPDASIASLNPVQQQAVTHRDGAVLILAGPGSGKTRVITHRIAHLVGVHNVHPWRILAVTFTNKAAREMRERVQYLLGESASDVHLGTFHAMCARWLRIDGACIGVDSSFAIYDDADQLAVMKQVLDTLNVDPRSFPPRAILDAISRAKNELIGQEEFADRVSSYGDEVVSRAYRAYQSTLQSGIALDFDDLLIEALRLFRESPEAKEKYAGRYLHVMVDEFQDTNPVQYQLARELASEHGNICVVGDPDQSIYSWRAADARNVEYFRRDWPDAAVYLLEQNYRSTSAILKAADAVIARNPGRTPRTLWTEREDGDAIVTYEAYNDEEEGEFVAREVSRLTAAGRRYSDVAVMYRVNAQSRPIEEALVRHRIPYRLIGGVRFYQRREIKDLVAYLRLIHNRHDEASWNRVVNVPPRGIGAKTVERLHAWAGAYGLRIADACEAVSRGEHLPGITPRAAAAVTAFTDGLQALRQQDHESLGELLDAVIEFSGYSTYLSASNDRAEERLENVGQLRAVMDQYTDLSGEEGDLASFLQDVALVSDVDEIDSAADAVTLLTLHSAKGLEYPVVFMVGMEEGLLPHIRSLEDPDGMEEERRLAYVGITRAGDQLYLTRAFRRLVFGSPQSYPPSRFLNEIPAGLTRPWNATGQRAPAAIRAAAPEFNPAEAAWAPGDRVLHPKFGTGTVVAVQQRSGDVEISVAFDEAGVKRLAQSLAPLSAAG
jgi:DNA helicase II / ATP-dependent DNA helicase PcrA